MQQSKLKVNEFAELIYSDPMKSPHLSGLGGVTGKTLHSKRQGVIAVDIAARNIYIAKLPSHPRYCS
jgi:hypothetical protein